MRDAVADFFGTGEHPPASERRRPGAGEEEDAAEQFWAAEHYCFESDLVVAYGPAHESE